MKFQKVLTLLCASRSVPGLVDKVMREGGGIAAVETEGCLLV